MKTIKQEWEEFRDIVLADKTEKQTNEMEIVFFSGALVMLGRISEASKPGVEGVDQDLGNEVNMFLDAKSDFKVFH